MKRQRVSSREYKVMLRPDRFPGRESLLMRAASEFWSHFSQAIDGQVIEADGTLDSIEKRRLIEFFDTNTRQLKEHNYIFRLRRDLKGKRREVTLKFRHEDRYFAENRKLKSDRVDVAVKFEEDIKVPFDSLFSFSASGEIGKKDLAADLGGIARLFPDIARRIDGFDHGHALASVGNLTARELVITGGTLRMAQRPKVNAECALIVWYDHQRDAEQPVAVEFSYRYGSKGERYSGCAAGRAFDVFKMLRQLERWVDPDATTKTALVYR